MNPIPDALYHIERDEPFLIAGQCERCGYRWFPALLFGCEMCGTHGDKLTRINLPGKGTLLAFTEVPEREGGSFILAQIELLDGPVLRAIVDAPDVAGLAIGDRVKALVQTIDDEALLRFQKVAS